MTDVKVRDVMTRIVVTVTPGEGVNQAAAKLSGNHISGAPVVEDDRVVGIISEADLLRAALPPVPVDHGTSVFDALELIAKARIPVRKHGLTVADVMSTPVVDITEDVSVFGAAERMDRRGVKRLPVVDAEGYLVGIVSRADVIRAIARDDASIRLDVLGSIAVLGDEVFEDLVVDVDAGVVTLRGMADRRSTREIAVRIASRCPGVLEVIDRLEEKADDAHTSRPPTPDPRTNWIDEPALT